MNFVAEWALQALGADENPGQLRLYSEALRTACETAPPPFGTQWYGDLFRAAAMDPAWIAASLVTNAEREAEGSTRLWTLSSSTPDAEIAAQVKQHAIDESRHSRWYIAVLDVTFPGALDESLRPHVRGISPRYNMDMPTVAEEGSPFAHAVTLDDLVQMNIAEIRTAINQHLQLPILMANCPSAGRDKLTFLMDGLIRDEILHIGYSARLIERLSANESAGVLTDLITARLHDFNEITCAEVETGVFPLHCSSQACRRKVTNQPSCPRSRGDDQPAQA